MTLTPPARNASSRLTTDSAAIERAQANAATTATQARKVAFGGRVIGGDAKEDGCGGSPLRAYANDVVVNLEPQRRGAQHPPECLERREPADRSVQAGTHGGVAGPIVSELDVPSGFSRDPLQESGHGLALDLELG